MDLRVLLESYRGELSLREAAKKIGISHSYLRDLETGKKRNPSHETLKKIANGYQKPIKDVLQTSEDYKRLGIPFVPQFEGYIGITVKNDEQIDEIKDMIHCAIMLVERAYNQNEYVCQFTFRKLNW